MVAFLRFSPVCLMCCLVACHIPPTLHVTSSGPGTVVPGATGNSVPTVTIIVGGTADGRPFDNQSRSVTLQTTLGSFRTAAGNDVSQIALAPNQLAAHQWVVPLFAPPVPGTAVVMATFTDSSGETATATTNVPFALAPQDMPSTPAARLSLSCGLGNVGALADPTMAVAVRCTPLAFAGDGTELTQVRLSLMPEAGAFDVEGSDDGLTLLPDGHVGYDPGAANPGYYIYRPHLGDLAAPEDVPPNVDEPSWQDTRAPGSPIRNPRDGRATLVLAALGQAPTGSQPEPYVDANDNGTFDFGEMFWDPNMDGTWDPVQTTAIWVQTTIIWTGVLTTHVLPDGSFTGGAPPAAAPVVIASGSSATIPFTLVDDNLNPLAAADTVNDHVTWYLDTTPPTVLGESSLDGTTSQFLVTVANSGALVGTGPHAVHGELTRHLYQDIHGAPAGLLSTETTAAAPVILQ